MKKIVLVLIAAAFAVPSFAASAAVADASADAAGAAKPKKAKMICRRAPATGSHMQNRICKSEAEWTDADSHDQDSLDLQNSAQKTGCGGAMGSCGQSRGGPR